jgi:hypothetical protein
MITKDVETFGKARRAIIDDARAAGATVDEYLD